jgi:protein TonB
MIDRTREETMNRTGIAIRATLLAAACALSCALARAGAAPAKGSAAAPHLQAYFTTGFDDAAWQKAAFDRVAKVWVAAAAPAVGKRAVVLSTITREGKILEAKIDTTSGSEAWDKAALDAVRKAAPFPALPKSWPNTSVEVHWHFAFTK